MNIIVRPLGCGKTYELVKLSAETQFPIVVEHRTHFVHILSIAFGLGLKIPRPITIQEALSGKSSGQGVLIDNADIILQKMFGFKVHTITMNGSRDSVDFWKVDFRNPE